MRSGPNPSPAGTSHSFKLSHEGREGAEDVPLMLVEDPEASVEKKEASCPAPSGRKAAHHSG